MGRKEKSVNRRVLMVAAMVVAVVGVFGGSAQPGVASNEQFVLTGIVYVEGGQGVAWLQEPTFTNGKVLTLRPGDQIGPYRLTKILEDQVELQGPGGKISVPLAGSGGAISVATNPGPAEATHELPPHPALNNPDAIVVARGDPSRDFPVSDLLPGIESGAMRTQAGRPVVAQPRGVAAAIDRGIVPPALQVPPPELPPSPALQNPNAIVVPRGDPRRDFPAATLLSGGS